VLFDLGHFACVSVSFLFLYNLHFFSRNSDSVAYCYRQSSMVCLSVCMYVCMCVGVEGAGLVPWVEGPSDASLWFYLREAFQSQATTEKILYNNSR